MNEKHSFENFIMQCCKAKEWDLRTFLKRILKNNGFQIKEDDFKSYRGGKYSTVHNMLATRGNPRVCLVAHTDVCRDHAYGAPDVDPVIKIKEIKDEMRSIIQDRHCAVQVGGDDRLGVAINTWIALNTGYDIGLLFTTDEEVGVVSAEYLKFPELLDFDILLQVDRGNHSDQLVTAIGGWQLCSDRTANRLLSIANHIDLPRYTVNGMITDVLAIKSNHMCKEAVNMTCGYHCSYGADKEEYIDIQEAKDTMRFVSGIIQYYYLDMDKDEEYTEPEIEPEHEMTWEELEALEEIPRLPPVRNSRDRRRQKISDDLFTEEMYDRDRRRQNNEEDMTEMYDRLFRGHNFDV